ncbi:F-box family protein [Thalictrum thalictroides]|uniref:F-box family protein n=1 Tax=Thalictrum thalictroides TaxID=46969 RepID=A0A7J6VRL6_THATH|nr:F-box family protein [Thalictrum thalictroides]
MMRLQEMESPVSSNNDILTEILSRLPAKSLLRFKCASKRWQKIISSDPVFQRKQYQESKSVISWFFFLSRSPEFCLAECTSIIYNPLIVPLRILDFLPEQVCLVASSNGLLCCRSSGIGDVVVYVCNPVIQKYVKIEVPKDANGQGMGFHFEPFRSAMDDSSNFKLVSISMKGFDRSIHIYSSDTGEWRTSEEFFHISEFLVGEGYAVGISGVLYWMTFGDIVLAFDVEMEKSSTIKLPVSRASWDERCIGDSEGVLHYILISDGGLRVWALNSELEWELNHSMSLTSIQEDNQNFPYDVAQKCGHFPAWIEPLAFKDGLSLLKLRVRFRYEDVDFKEACMKLYVYNLGTKALEEVCTLDEMGLFAGNKTWDTLTNHNKWGLFVTNLKTLPEMEIGSTHDDILFEILSRLSAKSLVRFQCVSKRWQNIISDPVFQRLQCHRSKSSFSWFFFLRGCHEFCLSNYAPFINDQVIAKYRIMDFLPENFCPIASSNGLLCCRKFGIVDNAIYVCNLAIKKYVKIEVPRDVNGQAVGLFFDPFRSNMDDWSNFKLVSISEKNDLGFYFQIYSSEIREWRKLAGVCPCNHVLQRGARAFLASGVFYWMTLGNVIIASDVEKETSYCITLPVTNLESWGEKCMGESAGSLQYISISDGSIQVWSLISCKLKWIHKCSMSLASIEGDHPKFIYNAAKRVAGASHLPSWIEPLAFKDGQSLLKLRLRFSLDHGNFKELCMKFYVYNLDTRTMEKLCTLDEAGLLYGNRKWNELTMNIKWGLLLGALKALPYSMSLAPLCSVFCLSGTKLGTSI